MSADERGAARALASAGPAFSQLPSLRPGDWRAWRAAADRLARDLAGAADLDRRIHHLYLPVLFFSVARARAASSRPILVGIQAPQGAGKSTLVTHLLAILPGLGLRGAAVSIDDFYMTREEQVRLAAAHPGHPFLEHRGYPGTHDIALGVATLVALRDLRAGETTRVPVYDKSAHGGRGDRRPVSEWRTVTGPLDLVFVEGWMLGFAPVPDDRLPDPRLIEPNHALAAYDRWHQLLDAFVVLRAMDASFVLRWRADAEEAATARGLPGLSRDAIEDYVRRFLPAYGLWAGRAPARFRSEETLVIGLDEERRPVASPEGRLS